jgi:hypothetical protein
MLILPLDHSEPYFATLGVMLYPAVDGHRFSQEPSGVCATPVEARHMMFSRLP